MSLLNQPMQIGNVKGTIYTFEQAGDILPMHTHDTTTAHITIVARGIVKAHGNDWEAEYSAGAIIDFPAEQSHEFTALEDNSRIVNIIK